MHQNWIVLLVLAWAVLPQPAGATQSIYSVDELLAVSAIADSIAPKSAEPVSSRTGLYGSVHVGMFKPIGTDDKMDAVGTGYAWGLSLGYRITHWLGLEGEFLYFQGDYERISGMLLPRTATNAINVASVDISLGARATYPVWRLSPFVGGGIGLFDSDLYTKDASTGLFENSAGGQTGGWHAVAGIAFPMMKQWRAELGWRWIFLSQDFGIHSNGEVHLGGNMLCLAVRGG